MSSDWIWQRSNENGSLRNPTPLDFTNPILATKGIFIFSGEQKSERDDRNSFKGQETRTETIEKGRYLAFKIIWKLNYLLLVQEAGRQFTIFLPHGLDLKMRENKISIQIANSNHEISYVLCFVQPRGIVLNFVLRKHEKKSFLH